MARKHPDPSARSLIKPLHGQDRNAHMQVSLRSWVSLDVGDQIRDLGLRQPANRHAVVPRACQGRQATRETGCVPESFIREPGCRGSRSRARPFDSMTG